MTNLHKFVMHIKISLWYSLMSVVHGFQHIIISILIIVNSIVLPYNVCAEAVMTSCPYMDIRRNIM